MRILFFFLAWLVANNLAGQLTVHLVAGSDFVGLPTSDYQRVRSGSLRDYTLPPLSFNAGLELAYTRPKSGLPPSIGIRHGIIVDADLSADFRGEAERCIDGIPTEITTVVAQARLQRLSYWQVYGKVGVVKVPEWLQMTISVGGGVLLFSQQRVQQAISQLDGLNELAEVPSCGFGFIVGPNRQLIATPTAGTERLDLGRPLLRPTSVFGEVEVAISVWNELQLALNGQFGFTKLANGDLFSDGSRQQNLTSRLNNRSWLALGLVARGRIF